MQPLYLLTAVDVRRAEQSGTSRATTISKLTLPAIKFRNTPHDPGGGVMEVEYLLPRIEAVQPAFEVKGFDLDIFNGFGLADRWVFAGSVRDKKTGKAQPARAIIEGAVAEWEPDEASPTEFLGCNHAIREVTHYEFWLNGTEYWYVDNDERVVRRMGVDLFADDRLALGA